MVITAELRLSSPALFLFQASRAVPEAVVRVEYRTEAGEFLLSAAGDDLDDLEEALAGDRTIASSWATTNIDGRPIYGAVAIDDPFLTEMRRETGVAIAENSVVDGEWYLVLELPDEGALAAVGSFCREHDVAMRVEELHLEGEASAVDEFGLTAAQREALVAAHERGYFNDPRDVTLADLSAELDVSASALGRRMRRGLDAMIQRTLRRNER